MSGSLILLLFVSYVGNVQSTGFNCVICSGRQSNFVCNYYGSSECPSDKQACWARKTDLPPNPISEISVDKNCIAIDECGLPNQLVCTGDQCEYCCLASGCNYELTPPEITSTTRPNTTSTEPTTATTTTQATTTPSPVGPPGPPGPPGPMGPKGSTSKKGARGHRGKPGKKGSHGVAGHKGDPGYGMKGDAGYPGLSGQKGQKGQRGFWLSDDLPKGDKGDTGLIGIPGVPGAPGVKGDVGHCLYPEPFTYTEVAFSLRAEGVEQDEDFFEHIEIGQVITDKNTGPFVGGQMRFAAPVPGIYTFHVTSVANGINGAVPLVLFRNADEVVTTARTDQSSVGASPVGTVTIALDLEAGDEVSVQIRPRGGPSGGVAYSESDVTFTGYLIH